MERLAGIILTGVTSAVLVVGTVWLTGLHGAPEWEWPLALLLLLPVFALPLQPLLTGVNRLAVGDSRFLEGGLSLRVALAWLPRALTMAGLALAVIALAGPGNSNKETVRRSEGLDIMLAIDTSCSMQAEDMVPGKPISRLQVVKDVVDRFIEDRPDDRIGVVAFGETAFTHVPLTLDHDTLRDVMQFVNIGVAGDGATAVGTALAVASKRMKALEAPSRLVILLTDGQSNTGRSPMEAAEAAAAVGIRVYTIGVGARASRGLLGRASGLDEATLGAIAEATNGRYFRARDAKTLDAVYETIDVLEVSPAEVEEIAEFIHWYPWALAPGLLGLVLAFLLSQTWLRRGP